MKHYNNIIHILGFRVWGREGEREREKEEGGISFLL